MTGTSKIKILHLLELAVVILLGSAGMLYLHLVANSHYIEGITLMLQARNNDYRDFDPKEYQQLKEITRLKVEQYITKIEDNFLDEGMITNRNVQGESIDFCDSLLFSSIYFAALNKLSYKSLAEQTWSAIEQSTSTQGWLRHPKCPFPPPSRDMVVGVLIALSQKPSHYHAHLRAFFNRIHANDGFFAGGSLFVSYLSPGLAEIMRKFARLEGLGYDEIPDQIRRGFSTIEWSVAFANSGYESHLHALNAWLELELANQISNNRDTPIRSLTDGFDPAFVSLSPKPISDQRLEWVTQKLVDKDPENLFYRYLRYRTARAFTKKIKAEMLRELMAMHQFPNDRLPNDCDRKADYLWQRDSREYQRSAASCSRLFSGVDFVWMAALLLADNDEGYAH